MMSLVEASFGNCMILTRNDSHAYEWGHVFGEKGAKQRHMELFGTEHGL